MQPRVHRFVQDRCGDLGVREARIYRERQFYETRPLLMKIRTATGEALHDNEREISPEMAEVVRSVALDQSQRSLEPR